MSAEGLGYRGSAQSRDRWPGQVLGGQPVRVLESVEACRGVWRGHRLSFFGRLWTRAPSSLSLSFPVGSYSRSGEVPCMGSWNFSEPTGETLTSL